MARDILTISFNRGQRDLNISTVDLSIFSFLLPHTLCLRFLFIHVIQRSFILGFLIRLFVFFFFLTHLHVFIRHRMFVVSLVLILILNMETDAIFQSLGLTLLFLIITCFITLLLIFRIPLTLFIISLFLIYTKEVRVISIFIHVLFI